MDTNRLKEILQIPFENLVLDKGIQDEITAFYKEYFNVKTCTGCKNNFKKYFNALKEEFDSVDNQPSQTSRFKLRQNLMVNRIVFDGGAITQDYADEAACIQFLKANPNRISMFESYPENWKTLIENNTNVIGEESDENE